jgi:hypothetical protein
MRKIRWFRVKQKKKVRGCVVVKTFMSVVIGSGVWVVMMWVIVKFFDGVSRLNEHWDRGSENLMRQMGRKE